MPQILRGVGIFSAVFLLLAGLTTAWAGAEQRFAEAQPGAELYKQDGRVLRVYGKAFSSGETPQESANWFLQEHAELFGVETADLGAPTIQPVMYLPETGDYKFTLLRYKQYKDGIPVFRSDARILVKNGYENLAVWAGSSLRDLHGFQVEEALKESLNQPTFIKNRFNIAKALALAEKPGLANFRTPETVIWAGDHGARQLPRIALVFTADNQGEGFQNDLNLLFVADIQTGEILHRENLNIDAEVIGNISGLASEGGGAAYCHDEVVTPLRHLEVNSGSDYAFSDMNGDFAIANGGSTVEADLDGRWFRVYTNAGAALFESESSTFDLLFNSQNDDEYVRAQVNGYVAANQVRDFTAKYNPAYPTFNDTNIRCVVNRSDGYCPGNAWYSSPDWSSPTGYSINFCTAGSSNPNTAFASVVHHEFGHHLVGAAGSGQGQYGEGMGDVMSVLINDSPMVGKGFYATIGCSAALRNAINELKYPCDGVHACAGVISGSIWDARMKMIDSEPEDYIDILANLAVNAMLLHDGSSITPTVTIDYLTLDDDDANLLNGTPHYDQLSAGFSNHNLAPPEAQRGMGITPADGLYTSGPRTGPYRPSFVIFTVENLDSESIAYSVLVHEPWLEVTDGQGVLEPGATVDVRVGLTAEADLLGSGRHEDVIELRNMTNHFGDQMLPAVLEVDRLEFAGSDTPLALPNFRTTTSSVTVDQTGCVGDVNVFVDITHGAIGGLRVEMMAPSGELLLLHAPGGSGSNIYKIYDDEGATPPDGGTPLSIFDYQDGQGVWTLRVVNNSYEYTGQLNDWSLDIQFLGEECPPLVENQEVTVASLVTSSVTLTAESPTGGNIDYIITELPAFGGLSDPNGGQIASVPYTLRQRGNVVHYTPYNGYIGPDRFKYRADDGNESIDAKVNLTVGNRQPLQSFDLASEPGWSAEGGWAFGQPSGGGSHGLDPASGYTGNNAYGYNLDGDYGNNIGSESLTSGAIDCSDSVGVEVSFMRWLGIESSAFDKAAFQVSANGTDWTTIWSNPYTNAEESSWSLQSYDISAVADREPNVYLRWVMGQTDGTVTYPGWNLDDVAVSGVDAPPIIELTVEPAALVWTEMPGASGYDLLRGDLATLRSSGGDFSQASVECLANNDGAPDFSHSENPPQGSGFWYLVRGDGGAEARTYDSFALSQSGLRDDEIDAAAGTCP